MLLISRLARRYRRRGCGGDRGDGFGDRCNRCRLSEMSPLETLKLDAQSTRITMHLGAGCIKCDRVCPNEPHVLQEGSERAVPVGDRMLSEKNSTEVRGEGRNLCARRFERTVERSIGSLIIVR